MGFQLKNIDLISLKKLSSNAENFEKSRKKPTPVSLLLILSMIERYRIFKDATFLIKGSIDLSVHVCGKLNLAPDFEALDEWSEIRRKASFSTDLTIVNFLNLYFKLLNKILEFVVYSKGLPGVSDSLRHGLVQYIHH